MEDRLVKSEIMLKVADISNSKLAWLETLRETGATFLIGGFYSSNPDQMIDDHIAENFPELHALQIYDEVEGQMSYYGELNHKQLIKTLNQMGFITEMFDVDKFVESFIGKEDSEEDEKLPPNVFRGYEINDHPGGSVNFLEDIQDLTLDKILDKITEHGIDSLTNTEKEFLKNQ